MNAERLKILNDYKKIIREKKIDDGTIEEFDDHIEIKTDYAVGMVNFYDLDIVVVELSLTDLSDGENKFYLHFELKDLDYARELFDDMTETLIGLKEKRIVKILLTCTGGLTTGFFADKINEAAKMLSLNYEFAAVPFPRLYEVAFDYSVILLAPQIAYQFNEVKKILQDKIVVKIPPKIFAGYDVAEMINFVRGEIESRKNFSEDFAISEVKEKIESAEKILSIAVMPYDKTQARIAYRIYEKGNPIFDETVIKNHLDVVRDLQDILDTVSCRFKKFDRVGIAISGIVNDGHLTIVGLVKNEEIYDYNISPKMNLKKFLEDKYKVPVTISNNVNAAVLGYFSQQDKYKNILFESHPLGFVMGGQGIVVNGKLVQGKHHSAGEVKYITLDRVPRKDWFTPHFFDTEKIADYVAFEIRAGISVLDPEVVCVRCEITPDTEKLKTEIAKYIPEEYLPDFVYICEKEMAEYVLLGQMMLCLED